MDTDVSRNVVVFQLKRWRDQRHAIADGPTHADDCVAQAWATVQQESNAVAKHVVALHSEWEPSASDLAFIRKNFPKAAFTFTFQRPGPDGWDAAFAAARRTIQDAATANAKKKMQHVAERGELLPVLWSNSSPKKQMLEYLPHHAIVPGRLFVALATVAPTPHGTVGMNHLGHAGLEGRAFGDLMGEAADNLTNGLRVEGRSDPARADKGQLVVIQRSGPFASSALALPDFHARVAGLVGQEELLVGVPEPDTLVVTAENSGWAPEVEQAVLRSPCPPGEMIPTLLSLTSTGARIVAERP